MDEVVNGKRQLTGELVSERFEKCLAREAADLWRNAAVEVVTD